MPVSPNSLLSLMRATRRCSAGMVGILRDPTICGTPDIYPRGPAFVTGVTDVADVKHMDVSFMVFPNIS